MHSLSYALLKYSDITIYYVAPKALQIPEEILTQLKNKNIRVHCVESLADVIGVVDVLYIAKYSNQGNLSKLIKK